MRVNPAAVIPAGWPRWLAGGLAAAALWLTVPAGRPSAEEALANPILGDPEAIAEGRRIYRTRCIICHRNSGGRGPNLFAAAVSDEQFLETVINGRKGTQMPAFGYRMSPDEVWMVHAFIKSKERY